MNEIKAEEKLLVSAGKQDSLKFHMFTDYLNEKSEILINSYLNELTKEFKVSYSSYIDKIKIYDSIDRICLDYIDILSTHAYNTKLEKSIFEQYQLKLNSKIVNVEEIQKYFSKFSVFTLTPEKLKSSMNKLKINLYSPSK